MFDVGWCDLYCFCVFVVGIFGVVLECVVLFWWNVVVDYCCCYDGFYGVGVVVCYVVIV